MSIRRNYLGLRTLGPTVGNPVGKKGVPTHKVTDSARVSVSGGVLPEKVERPGVRSDRLRILGFGVLRSSSKECSYLRPVDFCITEL